MPKERMEVLQAIDRAGGQIVDVPAIFDALLRLPAATRKWLAIALIEGETTE